jgi:hypothetical protein
VGKTLVKILAGALLQNGFQTLRRWVGLNTFVGEVIKPNLWYALPGDYYFWGQKMFLKSSMGE